MVDEIIAHRDIFNSSYAALYHLWLQVFDPLDKKNIAIPPSGSVIGIFARSDNSRGVHKAPANEVVRACVGLDAGGFSEVTGFDASIDVIEYREGDKVTTPQKIPGRKLPGSFIAFGK